MVAETAGPLIAQLECSGQAVYTHNMYLTMRITIITTVNE